MAKTHMAKTHKASAKFFIELLLIVNLHAPQLCKLKLAEYL